MPDQPTEGKEGRRLYRERQRQAMIERRATVSRLYRDGLTMRDIAKEVGVTEATVCTDIHSLVAEWGRTAGINIAAHIATELERINELQADAKRSLELSKQPRKLATARRVSTPIEGTNLTVETTTASATEIHRPEGDPRWAAIIKACITERRALLRLSGMPDEADENKKKANTFSDFVAAHIDEREEQQKSITGSTKRLELPPKT